MRPQPSYRDPKTLFTCTILLVITTVAFLLVGSLRDADQTRQPKRNTTPQAEAT
jgi:hypothetical protein